MSASGTRPVQLSVFTRTGKRAELYRALKDSMEAQVLDPARIAVSHVLSVDVPTCDYVKDGPLVIRPRRQRRRHSEHCPYDAYLVQMLAVAPEGWVMILDDDALLVDRQHFARVGEELSGMDPRTIVLQPSLVSETAATWPLRDASFASGWRIDTSNLLFHTTWAPHLHADPICGVDKRLLDTLLGLGGVLRVLDIPAGVWANRYGALRGADASVGGGEVAVPDFLFALWALPVLCVLLLAMHF